MRLEVSVLILFREFPQVVFRQSSILLPSLYLPKNCTRHLFLVYQLFGWNFSNITYLLCFFPSLFVMNLKDKNHHLQWNCWLGQFLIPLSPQKFPPAFLFLSWRMAHLAVAFLANFLFSPIPRNFLTPLSNETKASS